MGYVSNITVKDEGVGAEYDWYRDLSLYYTSAGRLWRVLWDRWKLDGQEQVTDYEKLSAREFYYDDSRTRYLVHDVDPNNDWQPIGDWRWTDYAGVQPYGDFTTDANHVVAEDTRYLSQLGTHAQQAVSTSDIEYLHGDLLRSTMLTTNGSGSPVARVSYTAFGESIGDASQLGTRYQYAGGCGYESDLLALDGAAGTASIALQHVGARWYQPSIGRFVQRDPIGIHGGLNTYAYCGGEPVANADPTGLVPPGGGCPYCGKMYCHCYDKPRPRAPRPAAPPAPPAPRRPRISWEIVIHESTASGVGLRGVTAGRRGMYGIYRVDSRFAVLTR